VSLQVEAAEALCSALYQMPFAEFLGEDDVRDEHHLWFHLGERPKDMRVTVIRPEKKEEVRVLVEWRNYHADPRNPLKGSKTITISTYAATQAMLMAPTTDAISEVLSLFQQVLSETGVAGDIAALTSHGVNSEDGDGSE